MSKSKDGRTGPENQPVTDADLPRENDGPQIVLKYNDPVDSAMQFYLRHPHVIARYQKELFEYRGTKYHRISDETLRTEIYNFLADAVVRVDTPDMGTVLRHYRATTTNVNHIVDAFLHLKDRVFIRDEVQMPSWLHDAGATRPDVENVIALDNCIIDLIPGTTIQHTKNYFSTIALPFKYDANAGCEKWSAFVQQIFPDPKTRREFQKAVGYTLSSDRSQDKIFLLIGPKRSGKGTIMRVLTTLLGEENALSSKLSQLRDRFGPEGLIGKKAVFYPDERLKNDTSEIMNWLLSLSGGDNVEISRKHIGSWKGRPTIRIWIGTNETPSFEDASGVIVSRFIVFKFVQSFAGCEDTELTGKLLAELPGILNWAREGLRMLQEDGRFHQTDAAADMVERMADMASPTLRFAREHMILEPGASEEVRTVYKRYEVECEAAGNNPQSETRFMGTIVDGLPGVERRHPGPRGKQTWTFVGIRLRRESEGAQVGDIEKMKDQIVAGKSLDVEFGDRVGAR